MKAVFGAHVLIAQKLQVDADDGRLKPYENQSESKVTDGTTAVRVHQKDRMHFHEEHDFKEWEEFHTLHAKDGAAFDVRKPMPAYLKDYLETNGELLSFLTQTGRDPTKFSCGRKVGQRLSDAQLIWSEHWFEASLSDFAVYGSADADASKASDGTKTVKHVIVKHQSKFWTNAASRLLEGESCLQLLSDGSKSYSHDGLLYELKEFFTCDDISRCAPGDLVVKKFKPAEINLDIIDFHGKRKEASPA